MNRCITKLGDIDVYGMASSITNIHPIFNCMYSFLQVKTECGGMRCIHMIMMCVQYLIVEFGLLCQ